MHADKGSQVGLLGSGESGHIHMGEQIAAMFMIGVVRDIHTNFVQIRSPREQPALGFWVGLPVIEGLGEECKGQCFSRDSPAVCPRKIARKDSRRFGRGYQNRVYVQSDRELRLRAGRFGRLR